MTDRAPAASGAFSALAPSRVPSPSQRGAIEAAIGPLLVLAGPGAGKTFCLIERMRFLIEQAGVAPDRMCAFTFTNKAAGEIAARLRRTLESRASEVKTGTIHSFCAELLREHGGHVGLDSGFGIADEDDQLAVLRRIHGPRRWHRKVLARFSTHRFRGDHLQPSDAELLADYDRLLAQRRLLDFDMLVLKAAELLECSPVGAEVRARWDVILVDEFQDLNPVQYRVIRELARDHRHVFGVGDDEQSIYSWAGADPAVFRSFVNDFGIGRRLHLEENRRCPATVFGIARRLLARNTPIFADRLPPRTTRESPFPVDAVTLASEEAEVVWILDDLRRDRAEHGFDWGDVALLYRKHDMGHALESAFLNAGIPCRLAQGRALADDPVIAYAIAALRMIATPRNDVHREAFFGAVLPRTLFDDARARAEASRRDLHRQLVYMGARLPRASEDGRRIRRALADLTNLAALGRRHTNLASLIQELLSKRIGRRRSVLEEHHEELGDPAADTDVIALTEHLRAARDGDRPIQLPLLGGIGIALDAILGVLGCRHAPADAPRDPAAQSIDAGGTPRPGFALGLFKAAQLLESEEVVSAFDDFTAIDLETTDRHTETSEIVEIAAVRVRGGRPAERFESLVKPRVPISAEAARHAHGLREADVASAPRFEDVWPGFRAFCGDDVVVAHNGYQFDFRILNRMVRAQGKRFDIHMYDSLPLARELLATSCRLPELARRFGVDAGRSHRAPDDAYTLARVFVELERLKVVRARKTALVNLLGHLGVALALTEDASLSAEARLWRDIARPFALGRYSGALEHYERAQQANESLPTVDEVIERLGGARLMAKIRAERTADDRYPAAMPRMRRLIDRLPDGPLSIQLAAFLERAVLSRFDGHEPERGRVNLLTLHSTKGLEFSRVYILGVEDAQLPGNHPMRPPALDEIEESRRLLYVGMTRAKDRLVLTRAESRDGRPTGGHQFLDEMELVAQGPA